MSYLQKSLSRWTKSNSMSESSGMSKLLYPAIGLGAGVMAAKYMGKSPVPFAIGGAIAGYLISPGGEDDYSPEDEGAKILERQKTSTPEEKESARIAVQGRG